MFRVYFIYALFCLIGLFIQGTLLPAVEPWFIAPNIILILVITVGLNVNSLYGLFSAFALGLVSDFATVQYIGPHAAGAIIAYWIVIFISQKVYVEHFIGLIILGFMAALGNLITYTTMIAVYQGFDLTLRQISRTILFEAIFTAILTPIFIWLISLFDSKSKPFFSKKTRSLRKY